MTESDELEDDHLSSQSDDLGDQDGLEPDSTGADIADPDQENEDDGDSSDGSMTSANRLVIGIGAALVATLCRLV